MKLFMLRVAYESLRGLDYLVGIALTVAIIVVISIIF